MVVWLKALLFVVGGVTAAAGTAYVTGMLDPWLGREPVSIAALPETTTPQEQDQEQPPAVDGDDALPLPDEATSMDKGDRLVAPTFSLLRVEPDGSVVVAGNAAGESTVEILNGDTVIGTAEAGASGDFVIVLDEPLSPGDYQLSLRSMAGDVVSQSQETAVVSVPETPDGQVLALVDKPGAPAELVTVPEAGDEASSQQPAGDVVAQAPEDAADDVAAGADASQPDDNVQSEAPQVAASDEDAPAPDEAAAPAADMSAGQQDEQVAADASTPAADAATQGDVTEPTAAEAPADAEEQVASAPEARQKPEPSTEPALTAASQVVVEAVEIEGGTVFVAGSANPGSIIRVYANDILLGDARTSEAGRFLVEANRELPVGNYLIRADVLDASGAVLARAAVPFEREPGEAIAAVAPSATAPATQQDSTQDEVAVAEAPAAMQEPETQPAGQEPASQQAPSSASSEQAAANNALTTADNAQPANETVAAADSGEASSAGGADTNAGATAPALQKADGSVIIRRGDSLWRISRRVYGRGVRYSTIYLANQEQIRDPDMIWPGQVFAVPRETPEGDTADMEAIGDQAVAPGAETPTADQ
ncbi:LysM peptidoglycan-binding domain-containing protein [Neoaquamicrobium sediminum]|uniref:LysM peptidoglycan-binding domain-containing protein n=1 Tax=Neoaquamicrobium sediminum TaxID=1849104 RepID=UPI001FD36CFC|nr:LysM peptidoglycan-binding domain-containing protein [Mesorhizobium sediminum]